MNGDKIKFDILRVIFQSIPNIDYYGSWKIIEGKVKWISGSKLDYPLLPIVVKPAVPSFALENKALYEKSHWKNDLVADFYTEYARVNAVGYGEVYSPMEYWTNENLHYKWQEFLDRKNLPYSPYNIREAIYETVQEARPAYISASISLYKALVDLLGRDGKGVNVLDVSAYGERAIACAVLPEIASYYGVDPDSNLTYGYENLKRDLSKFTSKLINFNITTLEGFINLYHKYDIFTLSPPPYNVEIYRGGGEIQSHSKFYDFENWFSGFLIDVATKAWCDFLSDDGLFCFTALDRDSKLFPPKSGVSHKQLDITYVEAYLLCLSALGYEYVGAIGLSVGGKPASVPWWVFRKSEQQQNSITAFDKFKQFYPDLYSVCGFKIISHNSVLKLRAEKIKLIKSLPNFESNLFCANSECVKSECVLSEIVRYYLMQNVIDTVTHILTSSHQIHEHIVVKSYKNQFKLKRKVENALARWIMICASKSEHMLLDDMFPTGVDEYFLHMANEQFEYNINENFKNKKEIARCIFLIDVPDFFTEVGVGVVGLVQLCAKFMAHVKNTTLFNRASKSYIINTNNIQFVNKDLFNVLFNNKEANELEFKIEPVSDLVRYRNELIALNIRYEALGSTAHHYTRPVERISIMKELAGAKDMIDLFATAHNTNSKTYCSLFYDLENYFGSVGSAFDMQIKSGHYMANPVSAPSFLIATMEKIIYPALIENKFSDEPLSFFCGFTVWTDDDQDFITAELNDALTVCRSNEGIKYIFNNDIEFVKAAYILDHVRFPTSETSTSGGISGGSRRDNTMSVGIILGNMSFHLNPEIKYMRLSDLSNGRYYVYE